MTCSWRQVPLDTPDELNRLLLDFLDQPARSVPSKL